MPKGNRIMPSRGRTPVLPKTEARVPGTFASVLGRTFFSLLKSANRNAEYWCPAKKRVCAHTLFINEYVVLANGSVLLHYSSLAIYDVQARGQTVAPVHVRNLLAYQYAAYREYVYKAVHATGCLFYLCRLSIVFGLDNIW